MSFISRFIGATLGVAATSAAFVMALVHLEQTAPLSQKPSVVLRSWTGDLPKADLPSLLQETERQADAARQAKAEALAAVAAHKESGQALASHLQALTERIDEKQAVEWSTPTLPAIQQP
jgi:hypothetical protein